MVNSLRRAIGAAMIDWPRYEWHLRSSWILIRNRRECLKVSPDGRGVECQWQWTSDLHIAKVFPALGNRLLRRTTRDWPVSFAAVLCEQGQEPRVSFVIGHRGRERIPQLQATLATIAAQREIPCECVVVEQSDRSELRDLLPPWVRHLHTPLPVTDLPYCRAWALNVGARAASGKLLVLHDNDILVPERYAAELWARFQAGFKLVNLKRFIFYISREESELTQATHALATGHSPEAVMQNAQGGGSIAMARDAFLEIGGYDESFRGWGGEDNEFWERASTRKAWTYGYLPMIHLWHASQPLKADRTNPNPQHYMALSLISPEDRIRTLRTRDFGNPRALSV